MELAVRKSKSGIWGFAEQYKAYRYGDIGSITIIAVVNSNGEFAKPYVFRGEEFIPASQIEEEMGIKKYLNAKKPFYSRLNDGFIVKIRAGIDYRDNSFVPDNTCCEVYTVNKASQSSLSKGIINLHRILELPEQMTSLLNHLSKELVSIGNDREAFLKSRF